MLPALALRLMGEIMVELVLYNVLRAAVKDMGVGGKVQSASSGPVVLGLSQQQELETNNESLY
jgi:hypothetical protein